MLSLVFKSHNNVCLCILNMFCLVSWCVDECWRTQMCTPLIIPNSTCFDCFPQYHHMVSWWKYMQTGIIIDQELYNIVPPACTELFSLPFTWIRGRSSVAMKSVVKCSIYLVLADMLICGDSPISYDHTSPSTHSRRKVAAHFSESGCGGKIPILDIGNFQFKAIITTKIFLNEIFQIPPFTPMNKYVVLMYAVLNC